MLKSWTLPKASGDKSLREAADRARDAQDWSKAAESYRRYLESAGGDASIWVQYGHVLKEQSLLTEAEQAYRTAADLRPADADVRLHLAHLLKRLDRPKQAASMFREVIALQPTAEAFEELKLFGYEVNVKERLDKVKQVDAKTARYIELKDLLQYLSNHTTVTGITRVTLGLVNFVLEEMDEELASSYHCVQMFGDAEGLLLLPKPQIRRLVRLAMAETADLPAMQTLITEIRRTSPLIRLKAGDLYMIVGAFWEFVANPTWLGGMREQGVIIGSYIYDLIPITHAHYCMAALTDAFTAAFAETARLLDFALTISDFVARQVTDYTQQHGIKAFPTQAVQLAHELRFESEKRRVLEPVSAALDVLEERPFVLCVCTIEARKNHMYLFYVWQRMIDAGLDVPDLVFVGRYGWRVQDLVGQIEASRNLGGRLHVMQGLSDADLSALYDRCLFTVFPSFVEGWGLPVGESLAHGKVCVASSTTSIPEVGGDLAVYMDPFNLESGYNAISQLILEPERVRRLEAKLANSFVARTWSDVGRDFFSKIDAIVAALPASRTMYAPKLAPGEMLDIRSLRNVGQDGARYVANPQRLAFVQGWRSVEPTGTWMLDRVAKLRVHTGCTPGTAVFAILHVSTSPWVGPANTMKLSVGSGPIKRDAAAASYVRPMQTERDFWVRMKGNVEADGTLIIQARVDGPVQTNDSKQVPVALRLHALGYAASDDFAARLDLLEQAVFALE